MKFNLTKGVVTLTSETQDEALMLFALATRVEPTEKVHKPHKKHIFSLACDICGKQLKGRKSLGLHKWRAHQIKGKNHDAYKAWREKQQTEVKPFTEIWK